MTTLAPLSSRGGGGGAGCLLPRLLTSQGFNGPVLLQDTSTESQMSQFASCAGVRAAGGNQHGEKVQSGQAAFP